jgi:two-component system copper resistance phosphate regulon response regulator CusR
MVVLGEGGGDGRDERGDQGKGDTHGGFLRMAMRRLSSGAVDAVLTAGLQTCNPRRGGHVSGTMRPMKILIVEDEARTGDYLRQGLAEAGFSVDLARDGIDGMHEALTGAHDLVVLDVNLPGLDGWQVLKALRAAGRDVPVLFLTARDQVEDRVRGLELGADDYLVKPFAFTELLARVRTLLRRGRPRESGLLALADLELDTLRRRATRAGRRIDLTAKEFALLELFLRRPGEVLSRTFIASQVWDMNFDSDTNVVEVAIRRLRAKVDDDFAGKLIHTVRGMGYVMEAR